MLLGIWSQQNCMSAKNCTFARIFLLCGVFAAPTSLAISWRCPDVPKYNIQVTDISEKCTLRMGEWRKTTWICLLVWCRRFGENSRGELRFCWNCWEQFPQYIRNPYTNTCQAWKMECNLTKTRKIPCFFPYNLFLYLHISRHDHRHPETILFKLLSGATILARLCTWIHQDCTARPVWGRLVDMYLHILYVYGKWM